MIEQDKSEIEIKGVDQKSLEAIITYMYSGKVCITDENAQGLLTTCSLLQVWCSIVDVSSVNMNIGLHSVERNGGYLEARLEKSRPMQVGGIWEKGQFIHSANQSYVAYRIGLYSNREKRGARYDSLPRPSSLIWHLQEQVDLC